jgi:hypothetical protein
MNFSAAEIRIEIKKFGIAENSSEIKYLSIVFRGSGTISEI